MKYIVISSLIFISVLSISCSKEDAIAADVPLEQNLAHTPHIDERADRVYIGVIGHKLNRDLHGRVTVLKNEQSNYKAIVSMVNGDKIYLNAKKNSFDAILKFQGKGLQFEMNITDPETPSISNIKYKGEIGGYVEVVQSRADIDTFVILGTYEETGNETVFYGNWDMIVSKDESPIVTANFNNLPPQEDLFLVDQIVVSHHGTGDPFIDTEMENYTDENNCYFEEGGPEVLVTIYPDLPEIPGGIGRVKPQLNMQTSLFNGHEAQWELNADYFYEDGEVTYGSFDCGLEDSGFWTWNGRSGAIFIIN